MLQLGLGKTSLELQSNVESAEGTQWGRAKNGKVTCTKWLFFLVKIDFSKKCTDRSQSVIYDQEMSQSVQFSDFKLDRLTFSMFLKQLKNYKFWNIGSTFAPQ